jgi:hypothetical protein
MNKLKFVIISLIVSFSSMLGIAILASNYAAAETADIQNNLCMGTNLSNADGTCEGITGNAGQNINSLVATIINIFSWIVGVVCVIMIIYGGFLYVTAGGDTNKVGTAKTTILYAIIGLVIVALAQIIVKFVLNKLTQTQD